MSPGATMERVYFDLKGRILAGDFAPGERLDPARLADDLAASATPVRDALHRLSGERLVDSWHQEGFRLPLLAEVDLHDLYCWSRWLIGQSLHAPVNPPAGLDAPVSGADGDEYGARLTRLLRAIALVSDNREIRLAIANMADRSRAIRPAECKTDPRALEAVAAMERDFCDARWADLRRAMASFHRRRCAQVGRLAIELRPRTPPLG